MDFKSEIAKILKKALENMGVEDCELDSIKSSIENPPNSDMGDFAFTCFKLAKTLRKAPPKIAVEVSEKLNKPDFIEEIKLEGGYINFYLEKSVWAKNVINEVLSKKEKYGETNIGCGKNVTIDFSSPNVAKPFHVGHLRSTVIGKALYNIYNAIGYKSVGINHLGDWGTQFGKLIVAYRNWGDKEVIEQASKNGISELDIIKELNRLYVQFHDEAEKDDKLNDEARSWFVKMQNGDEEALSLWKMFREVSMIELERVYKKLGVKFDFYTGESFYSDKMQDIVDELKDKKLLVESKGAMIVEFENMPPCLILRSDGGTLYPTRDMATAFYRKKTFDFAKSLYVVAVDQSLHFSQFFEVIRKMGYDWADDLVHIPFGLVSLESGKLSTRKGNVILMENLLDEAIQKTEEIIEQKNPDLKNKAEVAKQVGIGAIIFNDLYNSRIKDVVFSWDRMLNFDGETGPYVQYTNARANSVLSKAPSFEFKNIDFTKLTDDASVEVLKILYSYPEKIIESANKYEPFIVTRHLVGLAKAFNKFYHENPILNSDEKTQEARLALVKSVKTVLSSGLNMLGIETPEKM